MNPLSTPSLRVMSPDERRDGCATHYKDRALFDGIIEDFAIDPCQELGGALTSHNRCLGC